MMKKHLCLLMGIHLVAALSVWANMAGIVIQNSMGEVISRAVEFEEDRISLAGLLERSGFKLITMEDDAGMKVLYLHNDGMEEGEAHPSGWIWNVFTQKEEQWVISKEGMTELQATHGDMFGFVFGTQSESTPPPLTFADVCETQSTAALIIDHSDGRRLVKLLPFPGETITGLQLLERSGLSLVTYDAGFGIAICSIDGEGQSSSTCFGDPFGRFWGFNTLNHANQWESSWVGSADAIVYDGDVHGYLFAAWGTEQPPIQRDQIFMPPSSVPAWSAY